MTARCFVILEKTLDYTFNNKELLTQALIHSSYANEHKNTVDNERLEFLGDAVLELAISEYIYLKYPTLPEGEMTRLRASVVCEGTLAKHAMELDLGSNMLMGRGEERNGGRSRESILSDAVEAVIAAIYLDGGYQQSRKFILRLLGGEIDHMSKNFWKNDCKTYLQELLQKDSRLPIEYNVIDEKGPDHDKVFVVELRHGNKLLSRGEGHSKKEAEQNAALHALETMNIS